MDAVLGPEYHYGVLRGYLLGQGAPKGIYDAAEALHEATLQVAAETRTEIRIVEPLLEEPPESINELGADADELPPIVQVIEEKSDNAKIEAFLSSKAAAERETGDAKASPPKKRRAWSPEARAAAADRLRARQAAGLMKKHRTGDESEEQPTQIPAFRPVIVRNGKSSEQACGAEPPKVSLAKPEPLAEPTPPHRLAISHPDWAGKREDSQLHASDWPDIREMLAKGRSRRTIASDFDVEPQTLDAFIAEQQEAKEATSPTGEALAPLP